MKFTIPKSSLYIFLFFSHGILSAQETPNFVFGNVTAADFNQPVEKSDSGASAIIAC